MKATLDTLHVYYSPAKDAYIAKYKDPYTGKRKCKTLPVTLENLAQAEGWSTQWLIQTLTRGNVGAANADVVAPPHTILTLLPIWEKHRCSLPDAEPKAISASANMVRKWTQNISGIPLPLLSVPKAAEWVTWLKTSTKLAPCSVRNVVQGLRGIIVDARGYGWVTLTENVFADAFIKKVMGTALPRHGKEVIALPRERMKVLLECSDVPIHRRMLYMFAFATGMRASELAGLRWEQVNLDKREVYVMQQLRRDKSGHKVPKKDSKGHIPLHPVVVSSMEAWKAASPRTGDQDPVFPLQNGRFGRTAQASQFRDDLGRAELPTFHVTDEGYHKDYVFHTTRSTFVSALNALGVPENDRQALMRHSKKGVTNANYTRDDMGRLREGVDRLPLVAVS